MKRFVCFFVFILCFVMGFAQKFGNEWINFQQAYYRIPIVKPGFYRISFDDLTQWGISDKGFQPQNLQIFYKGKEQYIYIEGENDGVFGADDFIEFYAEGNDGWLDTALYQNANDVTTPNWSMVNDTASYYLTWNTKSNNRRMQSTSSAEYAKYQKQAYCLYSASTAPLNSELSYLSDDGPFFSSGEGWHDPFFAPGASKTTSISTSNFSKGHGKSKFEIKMVASQGAVHNVRVSFLNIDTSMQIFDAQTSSLTFYSDAALSATTGVTAVSTPSSPSMSDKNAFSFLRITYPRTLDVENKKSFSCIIPRSHSDSQTWVQLQNFDGGTNAIVYDTVQHIRTVAIVENQIYNMLLPNPVDKSFLIASNQSEIAHPSSIEKVSSFINFSELVNQGQFIILTHKSLLQKAKEYANYRKGMAPVVVDIDQLYHQFGYGVIKHPIAIKNFCRYALTNWKTTPNYLFIIGKGIDMQYCRKSAEVFNKNLIPVLGMPGTDNMFSYESRGTSGVMKLSTGRLSAKSADDVDLYLQKVKEYEANSEIAEWKKHILHFGGGGSVDEQTLFRQYLSGYRSILEDTLLGASVLTFTKNSSDPIEVTQSDLVKQEINSGVSYLMFFGHAAATGFDQNIDQPSSYQNKGKYPLLFANSCYNGNIYLSGETSISEQWVLIRDKGMIGFLANIDLGYASFLNIYTKSLCQNIAYKNYGASIGDCIKNTLNHCVDSFPFNRLMHATALDMTFHGDPAIRPYTFAKPDLKLTNASITYQPEIVTTDIDSFRVAVLINNLGRAVNDSITVTLRRYLPDNSESSYSKRIRSTHFKDTIYFTIPTRGLLAVGQNHFTATIDVQNEIDELNETNNTISSELVVSSNDMLPVFPPEFAIYPAEKVQLVASSSNPKTEKLKIVFEIDTVSSFDSQFKQSTEIESETGLATWDVPLQLQAAKVYYWRVGQKKSESVSKWSLSSFSYIPQKSGWRQGRFAQQEKNTFSRLEYNASFKKTSFISTPKKLKCTTKGLAGTLSEWRQVQFTIDGSLQSWSGCQFEAAIHIAVIDPVSLEAWSSNKANYGHKNYPECGASHEVNKFFGFKATVDGIDAMTKFIRDSIPTGYYVLLYTFYSGNFNSWSELALQNLINLGAQNIRTVPNNFPYIFFVQKGKPSTAQEKRGSGEQDLISLEVDLPTNYSDGLEQSTIIGPAKAWQSVQWNTQPKDAGVDSLDLTIWGITSGGQKVSLEHSKQLIDSLSLSSISAQVYPYLQLEAKFKDTEKRTPLQLKNWQVVYDPVPETAVTLDNNYFFKSDTLDQGALMQLQIGTKNISTADMDSLKVRYIIKNQDNNVIYDKLHTISQHKAGAMAIDTLTFATNKFSGKCKVTAEFNPKNSTTGAYYQLEQSHFNNFYQKQFLIKPDNINPLLDVTFDGIHILDGDIVSAKPTITISLLDENKYYALDDTALFEVYLKEHGVSQSKRIYFVDKGVEQLQFIASQSGKNKARVVYKPVFEKNGKYELTVKAKDRAGNNSGTNNYAISFEVVLESTITNILNYPNPFSTSTRFVFTLTGSTLPTDLRIQILTVTGHLVKEISLDELGSIHIGRNITEYAWDGKDMYGDKLANGVYYYRAFSRIGNDAINSRATEADRFFTKGYGKLYIMR